MERDLMELQERKLFEYFIVVALHKTKAGVPYLPEVTQQFPLKVNGKGFSYLTTGISTYIVYASV